MADKCEATMEAQNTKAECEFDLLFSKNVPHILEKIFFYLDYESFKKCMEVNTVWQELLTSDSFKRFGKLMFSKDIEPDLWHAVLKCNAEKVRKILSSRMVNVNCTIDDRTLFEAARSGFKDGFKLLLERGANVNVGPDGFTPLHASAASGGKDVAHLLLEAGADVNKQDRNGYSPLHYAVNGGFTDVSKRLLDRGAEPNIRDETGLTPLYLAAKIGHIDVVRPLLERGADPNLANQDGFPQTGMTPLHIASFRGYQDTVQLLLHAGAEINRVDQIGRTPLHTATERGHTDIVNLLRENGGI